VERWGLTDTIDGGGRVGKRRGLQLLEWRDNRRRWSKKTNGRAAVSHAPRRRGGEGAALRRELERRGIGWLSGGGIVADEQRVGRKATLTHERSRKNMSWWGLHVIEWGKKRKTKKNKRLRRTGWTLHFCFFNSFSFQIFQIVYPFFSLIKINRI
jgi:hypothetical protein